MKNLWAVEWLRWPQWGQFWGQLVREHMRQKKRQVFDMRAEIDPATGHVHAVHRRHRRRRPFQNGLEASLTVAGPAGLGAPGAGRRKVPMPQTAPGRYEADFPLDRYGSFLLHASLEKPVDDAHGQRPADARRHVAESFGHVTNPYPREYLALAPDVETLARAAARHRRQRRPRARGGLRSGGRGDPLPRGPLAALRRAARSRSSCSISSCAACASSTASEP